MANSFQNLFTSKYTLDQEDNEGNIYDLKYFYETDIDGKRWLRFYIPWYTTEDVIVLPLDKTLILGEDVIDPTLSDLIPGIGVMNVYNYVKRQMSTVGYTYGLTDNNQNVRITLSPGVEGPSMGEIGLKVSVPVPEPVPVEPMFNDASISR